jgi:cysteinyl-tRNA synthetase
MQQLHVFNTLTRQKELFVPLKENHMSFYSCGPTVYHYAHIGNLRSYIFADVLKRAFKQAGYNVQHVMNITDVGHLTSDSDTGEDKMEKGAAREKKSVWQIAEFYTEAFRRDLTLLHILAPDVWCKATDHIPEQQAQVQTILDNGYAYIIPDGIYFDVTKLPDYGKLAKLKLDELQAGARVEVAAGKRHPADFALWKFTPAGERRQMQWTARFEYLCTESEYKRIVSYALANPNIRVLAAPDAGEGARRVEMEVASFPGWHIECSAMSVKYLGNHFDIHTGGVDHIPVHHTNELAQAQAADIPFANYWMHGEFLVLKENEKMAKSGENFLTVATLIERGYDPLDYRYFCLTAHYRKPLMFSWEALTGAQQAFTSLKNKLLIYRELDDRGDQLKKAKYLQQFMDAIADDINVPQALAVLWDALGDSALGGGDKYSLALQFDAVFGLQLQNVGTEVIPEEIMQLVQEREAVRKAKNWKESDSLRDKISALGYEVRDTPTGSVVRPK